MRIGILEPDGFSPRALQRLAALGEVAVWDGGSLDAFLGGAEALFIRLSRHVDATFLARAPRLRYLCSPTTGHTHIDLDALAARGIRLLSLKGETAFLESIRATPEHTLGLVLALLRNYRRAFLDAANPDWDRDRYRGDEVFGLPVGLIGYGRVGRRVGAYLRAMDAEVLWHDPFVADPLDGSRRCATLEDLIDGSRLVILVASLGMTPAPIVDAAAVRRLDGRWFVNTARGELVDEEALLDTIEAGRVPGVATDVIAGETGANRLARWLAATRTGNVIVTPHIAGATFTSMQATEEFIAEKLVAAVIGGTS